MIRRLSSNSARYAQSLLTYNVKQVRPKILSYGPIRLFHASSIPQARGRGELTKLERQTITEINLLRKQIEDDSKVQISKKSSAHLPELTDESLDLLYEALNMPDPPTEEETEAEQKRRKLLISPNQQEKQKQISLQRRLANIKSRLDDISSSMQLSAAGGNEDTSERLKSILQTIHKDEGQSMGQEEEEIAMQKQNASYTIEDHTTTGHSQIQTSIHDLTAQLQDTISMLSNRNNFPMAFPLSLLSTRDWTALAHKAAIEDDRQSISHILKMMEESGQTKTQTKVANAALAVYAREGDFNTCQSLTAIMEEMRIALDAQSYHHLVAAFVKADRLDEAAAIVKHLQEFQPASMQTYTLLIEHYLQKVSQPQLQSKAWSLFTGMRTYAHPIPDAHLYAQMIRACALGVPQPSDALWKPKSALLAESNSVSKKQSRIKFGRASQPDTERALDLFREMTMRYNIRPTPEVYSSIILACTRRKDMYEKGIELFQSMLEIERQRLAAVELDVAIKPDLSLSYAPDRATYNAVLQGSCQIGDLLRARWILAEMLRSSYALWTSLQSRSSVADWEWAEVERRRPDEYTLTLVFYTYATFKPTQRTSITELDGEQKAHPEEFVSSPQSPSKRTESTEVEPSSELRDGNSFSEQLPSSSAGVIREVNGLLERVAADVTTEGGLLSAVNPNSRMLNAYLSILSEQCSELDRLPMLEKAIFGSSIRSDNEDMETVFNGDSVFERWQVPINGYTCEVALDACVKSKDREHADALANRIWHEWQTINQTTARGTGMEAQTIKDDERMQGIDPIRISRCWASMIRNAAKSYRVEDAMSLLRSFVERYPPASSSLSTIPESQRNNTRSAFQYPVLTFQQIELLHNRIISSIVDSQQRRRDLGFITWTMRAYESSLSAKMPAVLKRSTAS